MKIHPAWLSWQDDVALEGKAGRCRIDYFTAGAGVEEVVLEG